MRKKIIAFISIYAHYGKYYIMFMPLMDLQQNKIQFNDMSSELTSINDEISNLNKEIYSLEKKVSEYEGEIEKFRG